MKCQICGKTLNDVLEHVEHILHECNQAVSKQMMNSDRIE